MLVARGPGQLKGKKTLRKGKEKMGVVQQVMEVSSPSSEGEGTLTTSNTNLVFYESDSKGEDDPIGSGTITPLTV